MLRQDLSAAPPALLTQALLLLLVVLAKYNLCPVVVVVVAAAVASLVLTRTRASVTVPISVPVQGLRAAATRVGVAVPLLKAAAVAPSLALAPVPLVTRLVPVTTTVPVPVPVPLAFPAAAAAALTAAAAAAPPGVTLPLPVFPPVVVVTTPVPAPPACVACVSNRRRVCGKCSPSGGRPRRQNLALLRLLCAWGHSDTAPGAREARSRGGRAQASARRGTRWPRLKLCLPRSAEALSAWRTRAWPTCRATPPGPGPWTWRMRPGGATLPSLCPTRAARHFPAAARRWTGQRTAATWAGPQSQAAWGRQGHTGAPAARWQCRRTSRSCATPAPRLRSPCHVRLLAPLLYEAAHTLRVRCASNPAPREAVQKVATTPAGS